MNRIKKLDKHTAELIAAGEVVERPASVIKELVENSIDAGATRITVEIKNGGVSFIKISDNGSGILSEDVKTAFLRNATSKIANENDLFAINTLGFRGEALASVAAVAKVELLTKTDGEKNGTRYQINGGEEIAFEETGRDNGTDIIVRDLFYNTPARMKFLKKDVTEGNAVLSVIEKIALSHPQISFKFIRDCKEALFTAGDGALKTAVYQILGKDFAENMIPVEYEYKNININGFISAPIYSRANRGMQNFFVNSRYVKTGTASAAIEQAYKHQIMTAKFPACVINIETDPSSVDVNVHPAKIEIRFSDEKSLFDAVYYAAKTALGTEISRPVVPLKDQNDEPVPEQIKITTPPDITKSFVSFEKQFPTPQKPQTNKMQVEHELSDTSTYILQKIIPPTAMESEIKEEPQFKIIGEAMGTYIIAEQKEKLLFIDKHAVHERIIFEKLKREAKTDTQILLSPLHITLTAETYTAVITNIERLNSLGFEIDDFGNKTVTVRAVPMLLSNKDTEALLCEIAAKLNEAESDITPAFLDWLYHSVACRAAVKAGDETSREELQYITKQALTNPAIRFCPHGRPTVVELSQNALEKKFGRI